MSKTQRQVVTPKVPASLIEYAGTGVDSLGILGKRVRITAYPDLNPLLLLLSGCDKAPIAVGAEGTVVHIGGDGAIWADFGDDERVLKQGPEQVRVWDIGSVEDTDSYSAEGIGYEAID